MIDHIAGLIFDSNKRLLVLRKKTPDNRKECILPGGKREHEETDEETLKRELLEELGVEVKSMKYYKTYYDKAIFEDGEEFKQTTYITELKEQEISVRNEIKEKLWISSDYEELGIKCNPTVKLKIIPNLIEDGFLESYIKKDDVER